MLLKYTFEFQRSVAPPHWILDIFFGLNVPYEKLLMVLESMFYNNEAPFHGSNRKVIAGEIVYLVKRWFEESARRGGMGTATVFESEEVAVQVDALLEILLQGSGLLDDEGKRVARALRQRIALIMH